MTPLTAPRLAKAVGIPLDRAKLWLDPLLTVFNRYDVLTPIRQAAFLAHYTHETGGLLYLEENGRYSAERILEIFPKYVVDLADAKGLELSPQKLFNRVYQMRMGNGPEGGGDGYRFRGRGLPHLTGRSNYYACGQGIGVNLLIDPDKLLQPYWAALAGGWFWGTRGLNSVADSGNMLKLAKAAGFGIPVDENLTPKDIRAAALGGPTSSDILASIQEGQAVAEETRIINGGLNGLAERIRLFDQAKSVLAA